MVPGKERPMKFMLMLYADEKAGAAIPPEDMVKAMDILGAYQAALTKAGAFVETSGLAPTSDARTVRMVGGAIANDGTFANQGGEMKVFDGPYADTREQFGGYFIIDVADMDEATRWAARCPAAQWGSVEIRPYAPGFD
jgi:hypothetical protein